MTKIEKLFKAKFQEAYETYLYCKTDSSCRVWCEYEEIAQEVFGWTERQVQNNETRWHKQYVKDISSEC